MANPLADIYIKSRKLVDGFKAFDEILQHDVMVQDGCWMFNVLRTKIGTSSHYRSEENAREAR